MRDHLAALESLRRAVAALAMVRDLSADGTKREIYARIHDRLQRSADEVEQEMKGLAASEEDDLGKTASTTRAPAISNPAQTLQPTTVVAGRDFEG